MGYPSDADFEEARSGRPYRKDPSLSFNQTSGERGSKVLL